MGRKKPKAGRICIASTFAGVDTHVKLIKRIEVKKDNFTDGYVCWDAVPMYDISNDRIYELEKKKLREMCVPVDYRDDSPYCMVYDWQIKNVK